ncbi:MAG: hypothetical protein R3B92_01735 [Patescibacteria group bacterium]
MLSFIADVLKANIKNIVFSGAFFALIALVCHFIFPAGYSATGSFLVSRKIDSTNLAAENTYFNYEGYYAQQSAVSYSRTFSALLESIDVRSRTLESLNIPLTEYNLLKLKLATSVRNPGPQLVTLVVKASTSGEASQKWSAYATVALASIKNVSDANAQLLTVTPISNSPVVVQSFRNLYLNLFVGFLLGAFLFSFYIVQKEINK